MKKTVLLLETIDEKALDILKADTETDIIEAYSEDFDESQLDQHPVHGILTRGKGQVNEALISRLPQLEVVGRCGVGLDNVNVPFATSKKIKVVNAPGVNSQTIAEHTLSLMLILQRNLYHSIAQVKAGDWEKRANFKGDEIFGKTLGILGLGNIGQKVAKLAEAFGMEVIYWNDKKMEVAYPFKSLEEVLTEADIVSMHLPLVESTKNLINEKSLALMKKSSLLINTARGGIIDQEALASALKNGVIAGYAADVLAVEPPEKTEPLLGLENALITAHVGSLTDRTYTKMCVDVVNNVLAILKKESPDENSIFNRKELNP